MPNCGLVCAKLNKFCVQSQENQSENPWHSAGITRRFSIVPSRLPTNLVGKARVGTLMLSTVYHNQTTAFLTRITDKFHVLSTISTGPITTTTNKIYR